MSWELQARRDKQHSNYQPPKQQCKPLQYLSLLTIQSQDAVTHDIWITVKEDGSYLKMNGSNTGQTCATIFILCFLWGVITKA